MPTETETEFPVLDTVVRTGDASIIRSTRFGQQVLDELQAMRRDCERQGTARGLDGNRLPDGMPISFPSLAGPELAGPTGSTGAPEEPGPAPLDAERVPLERRIDALVDHHLGALKRDLLELLVPR